jgi:hypothetical protein
VTLAEIALECFFPADAETGERLRRAAEGETEATAAGARAR